MRCYVINRINSKLSFFCDRTCHLPYFYYLRREGLLYSSTSTLYFLVVVALLGVAVVIGSHCASALTLRLRTASFLVCGPRTEPPALLTGMADDDHVEQLLMGVRSVSLFKLPPRATSGGIKSGEWKVRGSGWERASSLTGGPGGSAPSHVSLRALFVSGCPFEKGLGQDLHRPLGGRLDRPEVRNPPREPHGRAVRHVPRAARGAPCRCRARQ